MASLLMFTSMMANIVICQQGWESLQGPEGGSMRFMLYLPPDYNEIIGCATNGEWHQLAFSEGMYYSRNQGRRWFLCENGIDWSKGGIQQLDYDPADPGILYAAQGNVYDGSVYKTTDAGLNWTDIAPVDTDFRAMYCSKKDPNILLIGSRTPNIGIYRSTDAGLTWTNVTTGIRCYEFACDPRCPDTIYVAGAVTSYIWRSLDGGQTWTQISNLPVPNIVSIAVDPEDGNIIYCVPNNGVDNYGVYRSSNFGNTWQQVLAPATGYDITIQVRVSPKNPNIVWAGGLSGLYRSTNRGLNFTRIQSFSDALWGILPHPMKDSVAVISGGELWLTTDLGSTWQPLNFRFHGLYVDDFTVVSADRDLIYAHGRGGYVSTIAKTTNSGRTWDNVLKKYCNLPNNTATVHFALAVDPTNPNCLIVGGSAGVFKSADGGLNWDTLAGLTGFRDISFSLANYDHVWATDGTIGIYKSMDKGDNFTLTNAPHGGEENYKSIALHPADSNIVLAGTYESQYLPPRIYRTSNGGATWQVVIDGGTYVFFDIEFAFSSPQIVYACDDGTVRKSTDTGLTWSFVTTPANDIICDLAVDPADANVVLAGTYDGIFLSTDQGTSWTSLDFNLPGDGAYKVDILREGANSYMYCGTERGLYLLGIIDTIKPSVSVVQPNGGEVLYSGDAYNILWNAGDNMEVDGIDVFFSANAGADYSGVSYNEYNDGLYPWTVPNTPSSSCYVRVDAYDFAGNVNWDRSDNYFSIQELGIEEITTHACKNLVLEVANFSKPRIYYTAKSIADVEFALYNTLGQRMLNDFSRKFVGTKVADLGMLPSGIYFAVLKAGSEKLIKKVVVIK